jgi:hypothetical protein
MKTLKDLTDMKSRPFSGHLWPLALLLALSAPVWAVVGDNAPPIPATYNTAHPRLPVPDSGFLKSIWNGGAMVPRYATAANSFDPTCQNYSCLPVATRRLLVAYLASKSAGAPNASWLAKLKSLADLGGTWGPQRLTANDGVSTGTRTFTSASANFLTGCSGGSCAGDILSTDHGVTYLISSVTDAHTIQTNLPTVAGTGKQVRITDNPLGPGTSGLEIALIYDWVYADLDAVTRAEFLAQLQVKANAWEATFAGVQLSPYNDQLYAGGNSPGADGLPVAIAMYPDDPVNGLTHLKFQLDLWFNMILPVWHQVFGPEGGGWHEGWNDYLNSTGGMTQWLVTDLLSWQVASGQPIFTQQPWLKNFAYGLMYQTKPDFLMEKHGDVTKPFLTSEYATNTPNDSQGAGLGSLEGLAYLYNDPVLRGWARLIDYSSATPDGFEPTCWPYCPPDSAANPIADRSSLPLVRNFPGWGMLFFRTGWGEDDTYVSFKYGDNFWSHEHFDDGHFTIFNRGNLAIDSGTYQAGSTSEHRLQYAQQTVAHNTMLLVDPADVYNSGTAKETLSFDFTGGNAPESIANDGGQRRLGSLYNATRDYQGLVTPSASQLNMSFQSGVPSSINRWAAQQEHYSTGTLLGFATSPSYSYAAVDITRAYNNAYSAGSPNTITRSNRASSVVRHMVFIPKGKSAYVVVFDSVTTTNANFAKKWLLHTINQPVVGTPASGVTPFNVTRSECVTPYPYTGNYWTLSYPAQLSHANCSGVGTNYKYDGKLYGWSVYPSAGSVITHGGPGHEFDVEDPQNPGTYTNWNKCINSTQCGSASGTDFGLGLDSGVVTPNPANGIIEPGSWRVEVKPASASATDYFLNVMYASTTGDADIPVVVTQTSSATTRGATWSDGVHTYTVTFNTSGTGGTIVVSGLVNEGLLAKATQVPATVTVTGGNHQTAPSGSALAAPATVVVKDAGGAPIPNVGVRFTATSNNGVANPSFLLTDASGVASTSVKVVGNSGDTVALTAIVNGLPGAQFAETVSAGAAVLSSLACAPASISAGASSTCTVTLSQPAAAGGASVSLASNLAALTVPASVTVPAGSASVTFSATAESVPTTQSAIVTATFAGASQTAVVSVIGTLPVVTLLSCVPGTLNSGDHSTCTVTLSTAAGAAGATVTLSSGSALLTVPASVSVAAGATTATFTASAGSISSSQTATLTATYNGSSQVASVILSAPSSGGGTPLTIGDWVSVPAHGPPVSAVGWETVTYVPPMGSHCWLGTFHDMGSEPNFALNCYNPQYNRFDVNQLGGQMHFEDFPEAGHPSGTFGYAARYGAIYTIGMDSGANQAENPFFMWAIDPVAQTSRNIQTALKPAFPDLLGQGAGAYDDNQDRLLMHGGDSFMGTWLYSPSSNSWVNANGGVDTCESAPGVAMACPTGFASYHLSSAAYDSTDKRVYIFAGNYGGLYQNTLAWYDSPNSAWVLVSPAGGVAPPARDRGALAFDSTNRVLMAYGGVNDSGNLTDTWIYNIASNTWTQVSPVHTPAPTVGVFSRLSYDPTVNAFVLINTSDSASGYLDGVWNTGYSVMVWMYRYAGAGSNVGTSTPSYAAPASSLNRNGSSAWAKEPALIPNGGSAVLAFTELSSAFSGNGTNAATSHVMVDQFSSGTWSPLGSTNAVNTDENGAKSWADRPNLAISGGALWESHNQFSYGGVMTSSVSQVYAKTWNGSAWSGGQIGLTNLAGSIGTGDTSLGVTAGTGANLPLSNFIIRMDSEAMLIASRSGDTLTVGTRNYGGGGSVLQDHSAGASISIMQHAQGQQNMVDCNGAPVISFAESNHLGLPLGFLYVKKWNGANWVLLGTSFLNMAATATRIEDTSISCDGANPVVAWSEWATSNGVQTDAPPQIYVKRWNGSAWTSLGGSLNSNPANWAYSPSITWMNGQPYVAWVERSTTGTTQLYVKTWNGTAWTPVGGSLNLSASDWCWKPQIVNDGTNLYVAWAEQAALGQRPQAYVSQYSGGAWTRLGGSLNMDPAGGSVERVSLAVYSGQPIAAWGELSRGYMRQIYVKQWNGSSWAAVNGPPPGAASACDLNKDGVVDSSDVQAAVSQALGTVPCTSADLQQIGQCTVVGVQRVISASLGGACLTGR